MGKRITCRESFLKSDAVKMEGLSSLYGRDRDHED